MADKRTTQTTGVWLSIPESQEMVNTTDRLTADLATLQAAARELIEVMKSAKDRHGFSSWEMLHLHHGTCPLVMDALAALVKEGDRCVT
jgi:hypothetical protein